MVSPTGSGSGTGGSGSLGSPASITQREVETSAWTEINKTALGIAHDSIDIAFTQVQKRYSESHLGTETGYRASEDQPLLDHPLEKMRVLSSFNPLADESSAATYEELIHQLPPVVLERFIFEMKKPLKERDPSFTAINNLFISTAIILTHITTHCQPTAEGTLEAARTETNLFLPILAMKQAVINNEELAKEARAYITECGANMRHFDSYLNAITQLEGAAQALKQVDVKALVQK